MRLVRAANESKLLSGNLRRFDKYSYQKQKSLAGKTQINKRRREANMGIDKEEDKSENPKDQDIVYLKDEVMKLMQALSCKDDLAKPHD